MTLATIDPTICPSCGATTITIAWAQPALFYHGGYGATQGHEHRACTCGWGLETHVTTNTPREPS